MKLTKSLEDYIEAAYLVKKENGAIRLKDVAKKVCVELPSANQAMKRLAEKGLVEYEKYELIKLTEEGERAGSSVYRKHQVLFDFLTKILKVDEKTASEEACCMEHYLSSKTINKLMKFIKIQKSS